MKISIKGSFIFISDEKKKKSPLLKYKPIKVPKKNLQNDFELP